MYFEESGASKLCLLALIACLSSQGFTWIDCQQLSPLIVKFGASEIPRNEFLLKLEQSITPETKLAPVNSSQLALVIDDFISILKNKFKIL